MVLFLPALAVSEAGRPEGCWQPEPAGGRCSGEAFAQVGKAGAAEMGQGRSLAGEEGVLQAGQLQGQDGTQPKSSTI